MTENQFISFGWWKSKLPLNGIVIIVFNTLITQIKLSAHEFAVMFAHRQTHTRARTHSNVETSVHCVYFQPLKLIISSRFEHKCSLLMPKKSFSLKIKKNAGYFIQINFIFFMISPHCDTVPFYLGRSKTENELYVSMLKSEFSLMMICFQCIVSFFLVVFLSFWLASLAHARSLLLLCAFVFVVCFFPSFSEFSLKMETCGTWTQNERSHIASYETILAIAWWIESIHVIRLNFSRSIERKFVTSKNYDDWNLKISNKDHTLFTIGWHTFFCSHSLSTNRRE